MIRRLDSTACEKVWGSTNTEPWYRNPENRDIGEIWFHASDSVPLLVKLLFTSDNLSVQVHPGDDYAREHHGSRGKTEMWHILRAEPDAKIALGLRKSVSAAHLGRAAQSGEIMDLLNWIPARPGDTFFVPAGTIHAIGGGLALCEVQQYSDVTYRLYDYGRPRELHLDHSLAVSNLSEHAAGVVCLPVECAYFRTEVLSIRGSATARGTIFVALEGSGTIASQPFAPGDAFETDTGSPPLNIVSEHARVLITSPG
ncbi:MAG TPA: class I mannose-6-phosphate isomerase [Bryobacteraceae bacterium]|nr:class I mannose-6-phosphate isomerase [Bryobacteraceae bacterium]